ncbi:hypothetical protein [Azospirillum sp. TSO22-1]|uniref:hypothetical protein n=1 Tax=Azospirillum sp. TSO22-1 TaxID=716789 RepID=UPI000D60FF8F|nr:hypothetical protein [Azospirillum sp. TSO22-1]PWC37172.1 hypothetical protein TSO221_27980 [Azospirillum sp. TSO22-1]
MRSVRPLRGLCAAALIALASAAGPAAAQIKDLEAYAAALAASLAKACPMAPPGDTAAHEACRKAIGLGAEASMRDYIFQFGGDQAGKRMKDKKTSVFRGDLYQDLYMSLYMYTGKSKVFTAPDGERGIAVQAYFRNTLPPGRYPYPFWHTDGDANANDKWDAYETANELRFYFDRSGRVYYASRSDAGSDENRGPYGHIDRPTFVGEWMWRDDQGGAQPVVTLFSEAYSADNPHLPALDAAYRKMAIGFRNADCTVCHQPEGHRKMNKLTLLQTPMHAATSIDAVLDEVRSGKMPVDDYNDPKPLDPKLKASLLTDGEAFRNLITTADAWERTNGRPKARKLVAN